MNYKIGNELLVVEISDVGAELQSIKSKDGVQYLWQGDENSWKGKAIHLFPYVGRLTEGKYQYDGKLYAMNKHGFVRASEFSVQEKTPSSILFQLEHSQETLEQYPFRFLFMIRYEIVNNEIKITYEVRNREEKTMFFGLGGHPGFNVPLEEKLSFEDYYVEFEKVPVYKIGLSDECFVTENDTVLELKEGKKLPLHHGLFDDDAIVMRDMGSKITLKSEKGSCGVEVSFPQMPYLGIWSWPKSDAAYLCIEPWVSLPSRQGVIEDLEKQKNLIALSAGQCYTNEWSIKIY